MIPIDPTEQSPYQKRDVRMLPTFTVETHNFPTGVSPFQVQQQVQVVVLEIIKQLEEVD